MKHVEMEYGDAKRKGNLQQQQQQQQQKWK